MRLPWKFRTFSQLNRKSETWFFTFLNVSPISQSHFQNSSISLTRMDQVGDPMKMNWMNITVTVQKVDEKMGSFVQFFFYLSWVLVFRFLKIVSFFQFFADVSKKIYGCYSNLCICIWKFLSYFFRKWYWLLCYDLEFRRYQCLRLMDFAKFLLSQYFFDILILNILWAVACTPIKHYFLKEHDEVFLKDINDFNRFRFLAEICTNL